MRSIFFFTDLHGHLKLFHAMRDWCYKQDPNCIIVYGGDAADRGDHGYQIIKELLNDSHIVYLYGNHEDLFIKAADELIGKYACDDEHYSKLHNCDSEEAAKEILVNNIKNFNIALHIQNGGGRTLIDWLLDGADEDIIDKLRNLPRIYQYNNIDFCHAGGAEKAFNSVLYATTNKKVIPHYDEENIIWDRNCLNYGWTTGRIVVFGHTPTLYLHSRITHGRTLKDVQPCAWQSLVSSDKTKRGGWKIDMDTAMIQSNRSFVLNCNTLQLQGFEMKNQQIILFKPDMEIEI